MTTMTKQNLAVTIEPFDYSVESYEQIVTIFNLCEPLYRESPEIWQRRDKLRNPDHVCERYVVRRSANGELIASGVVAHGDWGHDPRQFFIGGTVHPDHQGMGVGSAMYEHAMQILKPFRPTSVNASTYSDQLNGIRLLENRGYELTTREYNSAIDLAEFEPEKWADVVHRVETSGIVIKDFAELHRDGPDFMRKYYDLFCEIGPDVPYHGTFVADPFDVWLKQFADDPTRIEGGYQIALDGDEFVGMTELFGNPPADETLYNGLTAVKRTHRRRGIATALKVRSLDYAKANYRQPDGSYPRVVTTNESNNPMYLLNAMLGYKPQPDYLKYTKSFEYEADN